MEGLNISMVPRFGDMIVKGLINKAIPEALKKAVSGFDKAIPAYINRLLYNLGDSSDIFSFLGMESPKLKALNLSKYDKTEVSWDGKSKKALEDVIPHQLANIEAELRRANAYNMSADAQSRIKNVSEITPRYYDYDAGRFIEGSKLREKYYKAVGAKIKMPFMDASFAVDEILSWSLTKPKDETGRELTAAEIQSRKDAIDKIVMEAVVDGSLDVKKVAPEIRKFARSIGMSKNETRSLEVSVLDNIYDARDAINEFRENIASGKEGSVFANLYNENDINAKGMNEELVNKLVSIFLTAKTDEKTQKQARFWGDNLHFFSSFLGDPEAYKYSTERGGLER
jgi:hypothetical protein